MNNQQSLISQIFLHSLKDPDKPAIIAEAQTITYLQLKERILSVANHFLSLGIKKGDRVVLSASNSPSFIFGYFAAHLIQAIAVPIDPKLPKMRIDYIINKTSPKEIFLVDRIDYLNLAKSASLNKIIFPKSNQTADILFTSGTTGEPKGVMLSHKNIFAAAKNINLFIGNKKEDKEVVPLPLSHSFGLGRLRCNLLARATVILCSGFINPLKIIKLIKDHRATGFSSVPAGFAILLKFSRDRIGLLKNSLKYIEIGSAPMTTQDKQTLMHLLPKTRICMHYGLTEASRSIFIEFHTDSKKITSIGKPTPNVKIKIGNNSGKPLPPGSIGSIMIKANTVMQGYLKNRAATNRSIKDGWFITEDLGYTDKEGYYYLSGRKSDIINVGGEKAFPEEVESVLNKHQGIKESACVGIADPKGITGQIVKAYLVSDICPRPSTTQLTTFLRQYLEEYKIPKEFKWIDTIPKTSSGKIQRGLLK